MDINIIFIIYTFHVVSGGLIPYPHPIRVLYGPDTLYNIISYNRKRTFIIE